MFERTTWDWLSSVIKKNTNFLHLDGLLDQLYKYTRAGCTLRDLNTKENTAFYRTHNYFNKHLTYIWDQQGSLDDLFRGWIPRDLKLIMQSFYNKKGTQDINKIIIDWANKTNTFFFELWKECNTCQNKWELHSGISKVVKHSLPLS